jgi:demethylmenaquinone methyltransferase / 2-methoxy-6-polyprenyl-1,4-benzoquinol methylase
MRSDPLNGCVCGDRFFLAHDGRLMAWDSTSLENPHGQRDKARRVRAMFDAIAPTYERVNTVFSGGRDGVWRRRAVALAGSIQTDRVLDVACGTGDFARSFGACPTRPRVIVGCDFSENMLKLAAVRPHEAGFGIGWIQGDALSLPFGDESFTIVSCAFGVRNFQDLSAGLREMHRVLRPGGRTVILEFTRPGGSFWRRMYEFYSSRIMPVGATLLSGDRTGAYRYLPRSVADFVDIPEMCERLHDAGFSAVRTTSMTMGVVTIYHALKSPDEQDAVAWADERSAVTRTSNVSR